MDCWMTEVRVDLPGGTRDGILGRGGRAYVAHRAGDHGVYGIDRYLT